VKLRIPLFGPIISMLVMSRFARTMSILIRSGLPILQVLDMVSRTVGNAAVSRTVDEIAANVREGKSISAPMGLSKLFPPIVVQMVAVGEDTGKIDELLMKVSEYYDQQSDYSMKNLSTMIEPVFVLILGVMVLIMALAIFLPMWNLASVVIKH
jgi:type II secretory pathway component PulF